jgi:hypothetical protein
VTPLTLVLLYGIGGAMIAGGVFTITHQAFPSWVSGPLIWPLITVTRLIATLQGWAAACLGVAVLAFTFGPFAPPPALGGLRGLATAGAGAGLLLFVSSTWISRRPRPGSLPPRV